MLELFVVGIFIWPLVKATGLALKLTWGMAKVIAVILMVLTLPLLVVCLVFAGGLALMIPVLLIGIAMGLSGFDMTDSAAVQQSIVTLIPGMRYAFTTSIVGVVLSVSFNLMTRMANGAAVHALDSFYAAMSRYAGVLSVDPLTQVAIYQQEHTVILTPQAFQRAGRAGTRQGADMGIAAPANNALTKAVHHIRRGAMHKPCTGHQILQLGR